jgi:hypothetical protein
MPSMMLSECLEEFDRKDVHQKQVKVLFKAHKFVEMRRLQRQVVTSNTLFLFLLVVA